MARVCPICGYLRGAAPKCVRRLYLLLCLIRSSVSAAERHRAALVSVCDRSANGIVGLPLLCALMFDVARPVAVSCRVQGKREIEKPLFKLREKIVNKGFAT